MANHIIGLDIGTYSIKLVRLERGRDPHVLDFDEEPLPRLDKKDFDTHDAEAYSAGAESAADEFESAPTQVRERDGVDGSPRGDQQGEALDEADLEERNADTGAADSDETLDDELVDGWKMALDRLIERGGFDDDGLVVTFLPDGQAMSIHQEVPFKERAKVENILPHMLNDRLPVDPSKVVYDFQLINSTVDEGAEAVVGFARKEQVGEFLDELKALHVNPAVLGLPELLLSYALERCAPDDQGTYAVVDIGHRFTRVLVLHKHEPAVARSVRFGGHNLTEAIADRFDATYEQAENFKENKAAIVGPDDAPTSEARAISECLEGAIRPFVRDLRRTFQSLYAKSRIQIDEIFVCGGTSQLQNLPEFLSREFGVPVTPFPLEQLPGMGDAASSAGSAPVHMTMAASCALQQLDGRDEERLIDLRKGEFTYRGKSSYLRSKMIQFGAAAAILVILLLGMLYTQKVQMEAQRDSMRAALGTQTEKLFGEPLFSKDDIKKRLAGEATSQKGYIPKMSAYQLYYELARKMPKDVELSLSRFEVDVDRNVAQVYGQTDSPQSVERLMEDLRSIECLKDVRQEGELKIKADSEVDFHLHISSECS